MSGVEKLAYLENLPNLIAEQKVWQGNYDPCDGDQVYSLFLLAFGDADRADLERARALQRKIEMTCPVSSR